MGKGVILGPLKKKDNRKACPLLSPPGPSTETETGHFLPHYNHQLINTPKTQKSTIHTKKSSILLRGVMLLHLPVP